jgi:hypothetical protein
VPHASGVTQQTDLLGESNEALEDALVEAERTAAESRDLSVTRARVIF